MPIELERKLKARAAQKGLSKERTGAYVYGTMRKSGWTPGNSHKSSTYSTVSTRKPK